MHVKMSVTGIDAEFRKAELALKRQSTLGTAAAVGAMVADLRRETPVDTGYAREHWNAVPTLKGWNVSNPAPYMDRLNAGSSRQAPARFIESTVLRHARPLGVIVDHE